MDSLTFDPRPWLPVLLDGLPEREGAVITALFYEGLSLRQVAISVGVSQTHVRRLRDQALERLRSYFDAIEELRP